MTTTTISNGQTSTGLTLGSLDQLTVLSGGHAIKTIDGGNVIVSGGATTSTTIIGANETIYKGGTTTSSFIFSQGSQIINSGGTAAATNVFSGFQHVNSGGVATNTLLSGLLSFQFISSGGKAFATVISTNGQQLIGSTGSASGTTIGAGGGQVVSGGGVAIGTTVNSGGGQSVSSGGIASNTTVNSGGSLQLIGATGAGITINDGGSLTISGGATTGLTLANNVKVDFEADVYASGGTVAYNSTTKVLTISEGGHSYTQSVSGTFTNEGFFISADGQGGTIVSVHSAIVVSSGVTSSGLTINDGTTVTVLSGGKTSAIVLKPGTGEYVSSGGSATFTTISAGATEVLSKGAVASGTVISGGGEVVQGVTNFATVSNGGVENLSSGGVANSTTVSSGGFQNVSSGGVANSTTVSSGGFQNVSSGGVASSTTVAALGGQAVAGGVAVGTILSGAAAGSGGTERLYAGGTASGTIVRGFGAVSAFAGGVASNTVISTGGDAFIYSGGSSFQTTVSSGGFEVVSAGGVAISTTVGAGGFEYISGPGPNSFLSGIAIATVASGAVVLSGGNQTVFLSGAAIGTVVSGGGVMVISSGGVASGTDVLRGGAIDVVALPFVSGGTASVNSGTDVLTVSVGGKTYTETLTGSYNGIAINLTSGAFGGTLISVACYVRGTRVLTEAGEVAVEDLSIGDRLITAAGEARPLRWIGRRAYAGRFLASNPSVWPVLIRAGALADRTPARDLLVSPCHAMHLDGILIPASRLANGASVLRIERPEQVEYFHLELETHDVIFAEGAASETFVDDESRMMFHNAAEFFERYPDADAAPALYCAPRLTEGFVVEAVRRRLDERAGLRGARRPAPLRGHVDHARDGFVEGWAQNPEHPEVPVCLDVLVAGVVAARALADLYRPDLAAAGLGSGRHSFSARLPADAAGKPFEVRRSLDGARLIQAPALSHVA